MPVHSAFTKYFHAVCRTGSIRKAARELFVASSAVNRQILKVENELGVELFERSSSGVKLTAAGSLLAKHIDYALADFDRTQQLISELDQGAKKRITIAGQESVIAKLLPSVLVSLHASYPDIATSFKAASGLALNEMLQTGVADIALSFDQQAVPGIVRVAERNLPVGAIVTADHPLASRSEVALTECAEYPLILPDRSWPLRQTLDREIRTAGLSPKIKTSSNSVEFLRTMLDLHLGIGFQTVVGLEAEIEQGVLMHIGLRNPDPIMQTLAVCTRADRDERQALQHALELLSSKLNDY